MSEWCVMASGPSMCQADADLVRDWRDGKTRFAMAVNNTWEMAPWADAIVASDLRWWNEFHADVAASSTADLWCYDDAAAEKFGLNLMPFHSNSGNTGERAMRVAIQAYDAALLYLLGFDMQDTGGKKHWHPDHPDPWPNPDNYSQWIGWIRRLACQYPGVEIINCTRRTALTCLPMESLENALDA